MLNLLKDELLIYAQTRPTEMAKSGVCLKEGLELDLVPKKATVVLTTVRTEGSEAGFGLTVPVGPVQIKADADVGRSSSGTQTITIPLDVKPLEDIQARARNAPADKAVGARRLSDALTKFRDEIVRVDHNKQPCLGFLDKENFTLKLAFDVIEKWSKNFSLELVIFDVNSKRTSSTQLHQELEIELTLRGGELLSTGLRTFDLPIPKAAPKR